MLGRKKADPNDQRSAVGGRDYHLDGSTGRPVSRFHSVPYPEIPLEQLYVSQNRSRWRRSKHTKDLRALSRFVFAVGFALSVLIFAQALSKAQLGQTPPQPASSDLQPAPEFPGSNSNAGTTWDFLLRTFGALDGLFVGTLLTSSTAAMAALYQFGKQRFSTVDVFSSEIAARIRTLAADNSVARIISAADPMPVRRETTDVTPRASSSFENVEPSQESQFENFHRRSTDLGALGSSVVDHVTAFYSYHLAARDELRVLSRLTATPSITEPDVREQVINIVFMVDLMAMSAIQALDDLIETREHRLYCKQLALCVATRANAYLIESMSLSDHRFAEITVRNSAYADFIAELRKGLRGVRPWDRSMVQRERDFL